MEVIYNVRASKMFSCHFLSFDGFKIVLVRPRTSGRTSRCAAGKKKLWNKSGRKYEKGTSASQVLKTATYNYTYWVYIPLETISWKDTDQKNWISL